MAMYWLDLVRYADTCGYHGDQDHSISPYRDYVIDAFNDNMPFDQFTREQLAGDLLPNATIDQKIATGYNRLLQTSHEGGIKGGTSYGATDELGYNSVEDVGHVRDLHATMLHLMGIDHNRFSVQHQGLDSKLTGVEESHVVREILA